MTVTATYTDASAKVTVAVTSAPANALTVLIERSPDQVTWTTVRGASSLTLTGAAVSIDDYEFTDGVPNYYRASYFDSTAPTYVAAGAISTATSAGASVTVTPAFPAGAALGHTVFVVADSTKVTATLTTATTGWIGAAIAGTQFVVYAAPWTSTLAAPVITATGLASGDKVYAKTFTYRNASATVAAAIGQANVSAATIAHPGLTSPLAYLGFILAFIRSINTSMTPAATTNDTGTGFSLLAYQNSTSPVSSGTFTVTGGSAATSESVVVFLQPTGTFMSQDTGTVTPALSTAWIKNPLRPYLNRAVTVIGVDTIQRAARTATFDVIARTLPVAVTDLFGGRKTALTVRTTDVATMSDIESCLLTGETTFVHAPKGARTPTGYFVLGDLSRSFPANTSTVRYLGFALTEVAAPSPVLAAQLSSWQTVISTYATWAALIAAKATWADVLLLVGSPSDVITS